MIGGVDGAQFDRGGGGVGCTEAGPLRGRGFILQVHA